MLGAALFTALLAQVAIEVPGSPVPITGQTLAVVLMAAALGPVRGMAGQLAYVLLGAVGLPFYSKGASGWAQVLGPTGGYLVGFIPAAFLVGLAARHGFDRVAWKAVPLFLAGQLVILAIGVPWLCVAAPLDLATALHKGLLPFPRWVAQGHHRRPVDAPRLEAHTASRAMKVRLLLEGLRVTHGCSPLRVLGGTSARPADTSKGPLARQKAR